MTKHEWFNKKDPDKQACLDEVLAMAIDACYGCPFEDEGFECLEADCHINESAETAILSFGDPKDFPEIFERRKHE